MAESTSEGTGKGLYFIVGGLAVIVAFIAFMMAGGKLRLPGSSSSSTTIESTSTPLGTITTTTEKKN